MSPLVTPHLSLHSGTHSSASCGWFWMFHTHGIIDLFFLHCLAYWLHSIFFKVHLYCGEATLNEGAGNFVAPEFSWMVPAAILQRHPLEEPSEPAQRFFSFFFQGQIPPLSKPASFWVATWGCLQIDTFLALTEKRLMCYPKCHVILKSAGNAQMPGSLGRALNSVTTFSHIARCPWHEWFRHINISRRREKVWTQSFSVSTCSNVVGHGLGGCIDIPLTRS